MTKLELIRKKCIEANKEIIINENAQLIKLDHSVEYFVQTRPITIADVLMAIGNKYYGKVWVDDRGALYYAKGVGEMKLATKKEWSIIWDLKTTLENQSEETIDFIYNLLK